MMVSIMRPRILFEQRLLSEPQKATMGQAAAKALWDRWRKLVERGSGLLKGNAREWLQDALQKAGNPYGWDVTTFLAVDLLAALVTSLLLAPVRLWPVGFCLGAYLPIFNLRMRGTKRQRQLRKELPGMLDLMTVGLEAGLSVDAAWQRVSGVCGGELGEELKRSAAQMRLGVPRDAALSALTQRTGLDEIDELTRAMEQAARMGVGLAQACRTQAVTIRERRRQAARAAAQKAPIKLLFPLVFFIFPTLFIVLLGPAVLSLLANLKLF
jgi:tight adherence protein C